MNYKEALLFIAQCLTVSNESGNKKIILEKLQTKEIDWDMVVKISTSHLIFPTLYINLKKVKFLKYIPKNLVNYMKEISDLNRNRNEQIILQAKELEQILKKNKIRPIFLKGTGNLIENLYSDISERMVSDIDFICSKEDYPKAIKILLNNGYTLASKEGYHMPEFKHYPILKKQNRIAGVEIHKELIKEKYSLEFNFEKIIENVQKINGTCVLGYGDQLTLSITSSQINDYGYYYYSLPLRNAYDMYLLSKKVSIKEEFKNYNNLKKSLNSFAAISDYLFGKIESIDYQKSKETEKYLLKFKSLIENNYRREKYQKRKKIVIFVKERLIILYKSIFQRKYREWLIRRVFDKKWRQKKIKKLGFKIKL